MESHDVTTVNFGAISIDPILDLTAAKCDTVRRLGKSQPLSQPKQTVCQRPQSLPDALDEGGGDNPHQGPAYNVGRIVDPDPDT